MEKMLLSEARIEYYYGSYTTCTPLWKEYNISCAFSKFYFIRDGECEIVLGGGKYKGTKGDFFFIPAGTLHSFYQTNDRYVTKHWIHFNLTFIQNPQLFKGLPFCVNLEDCAGELNQIFTRLYRLACLETLSADLEIRGLILLLMARYMDRVQAKQIIASSEEAGFHSLLRFIHENPQKRLSVEELAKRMHMHPNYFIRFFRKRTGMPPLQYMNTRRIEQSKALLENTSLPISEIMGQAGFSDMSAFSSFFKQHTGYSPLKFRQKFSKIDYPQ